MKNGAERSFRWACDRLFAAGWELDSSGTNFVKRMPCGVTWVTVARVAEVGRQHFYETGRLH